MSQSMKLKNMKPIEPWRPAKSGDIEHSKFEYNLILYIAHLMDMASKKKKRADGEDDEDDEENTKRKSKNQKSIFERENILRKPYESVE